ncbi:hypothetical protein F2Q70_00040982 [Brassica cretica]|uniref:Uncharacterized protein n=1 Tax=Brassica cretica TaxID=69181 RepID=A0A8S9KBN5_BRACR|nr:hypothetical protein F2Q70_00040982 [Brassica cretica]
MKDTKIRSRSHGTDVNDPVTAFGTGRSELSELSGDFEGYFGRLVYGQMYHSHREASGWDVVRHRKKEFYLRSLNGSTSVQPLPLHSLTNGSQNMGKTRGTGTYIPDMSQQLYNGNSPTHHLESSAEAADDNGASSCCNFSNQVSTSCASIKGEESVKPETCTAQNVLKSLGSRDLEADDNCQSSPRENGKEVVDSISSSSKLDMENGKEEESKSSQMLNGS